MLSSSARPDGGDMDKRAELAELLVMRSARLKAEDVGLPHSANGAERSRRDELASRRRNPADRTYHAAAHPAGINPAGVPIRRWPAHRSFRRDQLTTVDFVADRSDRRIGPYSPDFRPAPPKPLSGGQWMQVLSA